VKYLKAVVAVLGAAGVVVASAVTDDVISQAEWVNIAVAVVVALGVYAVPNKPSPPTFENGAKRLATRGGYPSGDTPASQLKPPPQSWLRRRDPGDD